MTKKPPSRRSGRVLVGAISAGVIIGALVVAVIANSGGSDNSATTVVSVSPADAAAIVASISSVPASVLAEVGLGTSKGAPTAVSGKAITVDGKPEVLYVGAEFCPFCAAERWPLYVALSRFGTFADVGITHSSGSDVYPNTPTLLFHGSTYTSQYLAFTPVETQTNQSDGSGGYTALDTLTGDQIAVVTELSPNGSIPFVDFGGKFLISGASYDPGVLQGHTAAEVAAALASPDSAIAKAVLGTANAITATLCQLTGNQPAQVCSVS